MPTVVTNSACSDKQAHLAHRLHEAVPQGAKLALCFDPEGDLDGCETIVDTAGRAWRMLTYQEDDPIDLRTDAVVTCHTEPVVWPESLQTYATRISRDLPGFVDGYWRLRSA